MIQTIQISLEYLAAMALGFALRQLNILKESDGASVGKLILYLFLPAVIVGSFSQTAFDFWLLLSLLMGIGFSTLLSILLLLFTRNKPPQRRALLLLNCVGYNLGNITIPFLQAVLPEGLVYAGLFATGDSLIALGGTYAAADSLLHSGTDGRLRALLRTLLHSPPFVTYLFMTALMVLHLQLPAPITSFCAFLSKANAPLSMLFVGLSLNFRRGNINGRLLAEILALRMIASVILSTGVFFLLPQAPLLLRRVVAIAVFSAIPNVELVYIRKLQLDTATSSLANTISIVFSLVAMTVVFLMTGTAV